MLLTKKEDQNQKKNKKKSMQSSTTSATIEKYNYIKQAIENLRVRDKRYIFSLMKKAQPLCVDTFFPHYGLSAGQFAIGYVLCETTRTRQKHPIPFRRPICLSNI